MVRLTGQRVTLLVVAISFSCEWCVGADIDAPPALTHAEMEAERQLAHSTSAAIVQSHIVLVAPELESKLLQIAERLAKAAEINNSIRIFIMNTPICNAWAVPNGDIFVTTGVLTLADNIDEVAVLLGHEMAHLYFHDGYAGRVHALSAHRTMAHVATLVAGAVSGAGASLATTGLGLIPISNILMQQVYDELVITLAADLVGRMLANMTSVTAAALLAGHLSGYNERIELRADRYGVRFAARAGFDARRGSEIFRKLAVTAQNRPQGSDAGPEGS